MTLHSSKSSFLYRTRVSGLSNGPTLRTHEKGNTTHFTVPSIRPNGTWDSDDANHPT